MKREGLLSTDPSARRGFRPIVPNHLPEKICFAEIFGNAHPVELEIGCGKGHFLTSRAGEHPEINFVGLDWSRKWLGPRSSSETKPNLQFIWVRAGEYLGRLGSETLKVVHIYFPDPWPKHRHRARRLIQPEFVKEVFRVLEPGGLFEIATDFKSYFEFIRDTSVPQAGVSWKRTHFTCNERIFDSHLATHYEAKFREEGRDRYYLELQK